MLKNILNLMVALVCFSDETMVINVFCGVVSGVLSSSLANPTDVLKVCKISPEKPQEMLV